MTSTFDPCNLTLEEHLESVLEHLPRGMAWTRADESVSHDFWIPFADQIKYVEDRLCALTREFFCTTATETIEQWAEIYGVATPDPIDYTSPCLKPEYLLPPLYLSQGSVAPAEICAKVLAQGGATCSYFAEVALAANWVMTCQDANEGEEQAIIGCCYSGCVSLGPEPVAVGVSPLNFGGLTVCEFGPAVDHPEPAYWGKDKDQSKALCKVPGFDLGELDCCLAVGYYEWPVNALAERGNACIETADDAPYGYDAEDRLYLVPRDSTGTYLEYQGHANVLIIEVDATATMTAMADASPYLGEFPIAGCIACGDTCEAYTQNLEVENLEALLETIVPAHLDLRIRLV